MYYVGSRPIDILSRQSCFRLYREAEDERPLRADGQIGGSLRSFVSKSYGRSRVLSGIILPIGMVCAGGMHYENMGHTKHSATAGSIAEP